MAEENKGTPAQEPPKKFQLQLIRGVLFPPYVTSPSDVEKCLDLKPRDSDIFVVTYPKCGTTWTQFIVWEIIHKGAVPPSPNQMNFNHFPFLEFTGIDFVEELPPPRTLKTHLPFNVQPYNPKSKYIYIVRNPWDCCVSYYYHHKMDPAHPQLKFGDFFGLFITGEVAYGDFFDHVLSWFEHRNDPNILFIMYEDMKKDRKKALLEIAKFLGDSYYESVLDENVLENCLKHTDFKYMKNLGLFFPKELPKTKDINEMRQVFNVDRSTASSEEYIETNFFRKGEVGDWKNHFSTEQVKEFNEWLLRKLGGTKIENFWQPQLEETEL